MSYKEFIEKLMAGITEKTGCRTEFHQADDKTNLDSVHVYASEDESSVNIMRLFVEESYKEWQDGEKTIEDFVEETMQDLELFWNTNVARRMRDMKDYEMVKDRLIFRLFNCERDQAELEDAFFRQVGDIALVLYLRVASANGMAITCKVPSVYVDSWGIKEDDVFLEVLKNTARMMPPRVYTLEKLSGNLEYEGDDIYSPDYIPDKSAIGNCLSAKGKVNGSVAIFYPGVAKLFCQRMNTEELYLAFTSIHEVMVHDAKAVEPEKMKKILEKTIKEVTLECDFLSEHIYSYNMKEDRIKMFL